MVVTIIREISKEVQIRPCRFPGKISQPKWPLGAVLRDEVFMISGEVSLPDYCETTAVGSGGQERSL